MNRLKYIVNIIDTALKSQYSKDCVYYGICKQDAKGEELLPFYYKGNGNYDYVGLSDKSAMQVYHRLITQSNDEDRNGGFGTNALNTTNYTMELIVFGSQKKIDSKADYDLSYTVHDDVIKNIPLLLNKDQLNEIDSQTCFIQVQGAEMDKRKVFDNEYPNTKYALKPDNFLFSVRYNIALKHLVDCETGLCENVTHTNNSGDTVSGGGGTTYSAEATALFAAMSSQPTADQKSAYNTLIVSLKSILGGWNSGNLLQIYGGIDEQGSKLNLFNPSATPATFNGSYIHHPYFGVRGNGTNAYINTKYNASTAGGDFITTSATHLIFANWTDTSNNQYIAGTGSDTGAGGYNLLRVRLSTSVSGGTVNHGGTVDFTDSTQGVGIYAVRHNAGTTSIYANGAQQNSASKTPTYIPNVEDYVLAANYNGTYLPSKSHVFARMYAGYLSDSQIANIESAINTFRMALWFGSTPNQGSDKYMIVHLGQSNATKLRRIEHLPSAMRTGYTNAYNKTTVSNTATYQPGPSDQYNDTNANFMHAGNSCVWSLANKYAKTVYNYSYAVGGSFLFAGYNQWNINDASGYYNQRVKVDVPALLTAIGSTPKVAVWWSQWNADCAAGATERAAWKQNLKDLINQFRSDTGLGTSAHWFIEYPHTLSTPNYGAVEIAQMRTYVDEIVAEMTNVHKINIDTVDMGTDLNHYTPAGQIDLGLRMATLMYQTLG